MTIVKLNHKKWEIDFFLLAISTMAIGILIFSFYHQYVRKIEPCLLCKLQRSVYFLVLFIAPIGFNIHFNKCMRTTLKFLFFSGLCFASYHSLIQIGWLQDRCIMTQKINNIDDYILMLQQPKAGCSIIGWKLFGLSYSIYNAIFSSFALFLLNFEKYISLRKKFA
jgi:disulfide bond formation protein DsbB